MCGAPVSLFYSPYRRIFAVEMPKLKKEVDWFHDEKIMIISKNSMELTYNVKNKILLVGGIAILGVAALLLAQLVFADSTASILPSSDGAYLQWTPNTGTTHYTRVDESMCNGTTDYNSTNTVGNRDSYGISLAFVPNGSTITAIEITPCASRNQNGRGSATMDIFYRFSGVDSADAGSYALTGTTPTQLAATTFSGLSFVKGSASTLQVGVVLSAGTKGVRLSRIAVVVTYITLVGPSNLGATNVSGDQNDLSWTDNSSNEDGFKVESSLNSQFGPFSQIATTSADVVSYSNTGLIADQTYYYRVRAFNAGGISGYSNTVYAITATVIPSDPLNLTAAASSSSAVLNWTQSSTNEEGFKVERGTDGINFTEIATKSINVTNHVDPGLAPGMYYYRVRAFNVVGNSGYSNTASTTIP